MSSLIRNALISNNKYLKSTINYDFYIHNNSALTKIGSNVDKDTTKGPEPHKGSAVWYPGSPYCIINGELYYSTTGTSVTRVGSSSGYTNVAGNFNTSFGNDYSYIFAIRNGQLEYMHKNSPTTPQLADSSHVWSKIYGATKASSTDDWSNATWAFGITSTGYLAMLRPYASPKFGIVGSATGWTKCTAGSTYAKWCIAINSGSLYYITSTYANRYALTANLISGTGTWVDVAGTVATDGSIYGYAINTAGDLYKVSYNAVSKIAGIANCKEVYQSADNSCSVLTTDNKIYFVAAVTGYLQTDGGWKLSGATYSDSNDYSKSLVIGTDKKLYRHGYGSMTLVDGTKEWVDVWGVGLYSGYSFAMCKA